MILKKAAQNIDKFYSKPDHRGIATGAELAYLLGCSEGYVREFGRSTPNIRRVGSTLVYDRQDAYAVLTELEEGDGPDDGETPDEDTELLLLKSGVRDIINSLGEDGMPAYTPNEDDSSAQVLLVRLRRAVSEYGNRERGRRRSLLDTILSRLKHKGVTLVRRAPNNKAPDVHPFKFAGEALIEMSRELPKDPAVQVNTGKD